VLTKASFSRGIDPARKVDCACWSDSPGSGRRTGRTVPGGTFLPAGGMRYTWCRSANARKTSPDCWTYFRGRSRPNSNLTPRTISPAGARKSKHYRFPGNLRELKNLIERAYILSGREEIGVEEFPVTRGNILTGSGTDLSATSIRSPLPESFDLTALLEQTEKDLIQRVLSATGERKPRRPERMHLSRSACLQTEQVRQRASE